MIKESLIKGLFITMWLELMEIKKGWSSGSGYY